MGLEWALCLLLPEHTAYLPALQYSRKAKETAIRPWKRPHVKSKLSDLERVRVLPWQEKPLKNPENTGHDIGSTLLAEPERDSLALSRLKRLISPSAMVS